MTTEDEKVVGINLGSIRNIVCERHEASLVADRSINGMAFAMEVVKSALEDERTLRACGWDPSSGALAESSKAEDFLHGHAPLCEWLPSETVRAAWDEARQQGPGAQA